MSHAAQDPARPADAQALQAENDALRARLAALESQLEHVRSRAIALGDTEERYSELLRISPYGILLQENGCISYINERGLQILGAANATQVLGRSPREFVDPEFSALYQEGTEALNATGQAQPGRYRLIRLDGLHVDVEVASVRFQGEAGYAIQTVFQDISERLRLEAAVSEYAERYRIIDELGTDYIYLDEIRPDGTMHPLWVTRAFERMTGYALADTLDPAFLQQLVHPDDLPRFAAHYRSLISGEPGEMVGRLVRADGEVRWIRHLSHPVRDAQTGRVRLLYGSVRDITEVRAAEEQLARSERAHVEAQRIAKIGHWEADLLADTLEWSAECYRLFGQDPASFKPTNEAFFTLIHPEDLQKVLRASQHSRETGEIYETEHRVVLPDGTVRYLRERAEMQPGPDGKPARMIGTTLDITERVESELRLQAEVAERSRVVAEARDYGDRYKVISELSEDFSLLGRLQADGRFDVFWVTDAFERMTGYTLEDMLEPGFFRLLYPSGGEHDLSQQFDALRADLATSVEGPLLTRWGAQRWVRSTAKPFLHPDTQERLAFVSVRDVTRRRMAEAALRTSERQLRDAQRVGKIGSWEYEFAEESLTWSEEMYRLFSVDPELFTPSRENLLQLVHPDDRELVRQAEQRSLVEREIYSVEFRIQSADGKPRIIFSRAEFIFDGDGQPARIIGTSQDVTELRDKDRALQSTYATLEATNRQLEAEIGERRSAELTLRASEERFRRLVEGMDEGLVLLDFDHRYLYANPAAERIFGSPAGAMIGQLLEGYVDHRTFQKIQDQTARGKLGEHGVLDIEITRADGERRKLRSGSSPVRDAAGEVVASMMVFTDTTEHELLRDRLQAEQREESIIMLAGGIAHDFNNMLMGVLGAAALIETGLPPEDGANRELAQMISTSANRMADLTNQLLAYARGGKYQTLQVDMNQAVHNASLMVRGNLPARVSVELDLAPDLLPVEADMGQIEQVLLNLLVNAIEAVEATGRGAGLVRVSTANELTAQLQPRPSRLPPATRCVRVSVVDTGSGMSSETLERVFEPFFSTKFQGRGLGLAACSGIVRNHGGVIWAQSTPGQGSVFHVLLPALISKSLEQAEEADQPASAGRRVLVIDDDPTALQVTRRMLESRQYNVLTATGGNEGLAAWQREGSGIDLVLLDMQMPDMSGSEVLRQIRRNSPQAKVLICSGYTAEQTVAELAGLQIAGFIAKPFSPKELTKAVEAALLTGGA